MCTEEFGLNITAELRHFGSYNIARDNKHRKKKENQLEYDGAYSGVLHEMSRDTHNSLALVVDMSSIIRLAVYCTYDEILMREEAKLLYNEIKSSYARCFKA